MLILFNTHSHLKKHFRLVFEKSGLEASLSTILASSTKERTRQLANKLLQLYSEGNYWTQHREMKRCEEVGRFYCKNIEINN
jgi:hypothetical protein